MKILDKVKIGAINYRVKIVPTWRGRSDEDGVCSNEKQDGGNTIYLYDGLSQESLEESLLHEAFHAMNSELNHDFLDSFSRQVYAFLKDNNLLK